MGIERNRHYLSGDQTNEYGKERCREPEGVEDMRCTKKFTQRASNKGGKGKTIRALTCFEPLPGALIAITAKHIPQNHTHYELLCPQGSSSLKISWVAPFTHLRAPCTIPALPCPPVRQSCVFFSLFAVNEASIPTKLSFHIKVSYSKCFLKQFFTCIISLINAFKNETCVCFKEPLLNAEEDALHEDSNFLFLIRAVLSFRGSLVAWPVTLATMTPKHCLLGFLITLFPTGAAGKCFVSF